jgi:hypothetical protein
MRPLIAILACFVLVGFSGCRQSTGLSDPPHTWEVRTDIAREPHSYFYCTNGNHEPRDSVEAADAWSWYAHR